ncbi:MAG: cation diffusion facilitator family transporter [Thermoplasmata archaeon]|nr:cation diffusion facilitator family transporter [Thermoplasmata archaeon]
MRSTVIINATLLLNAALFSVNILVAFQSGSRAVLSQAVYCVTDLVGGIMLLWGFVVSRRPANPNHPFGYGKERYFWSFVAALVTFTVAGFVVFVSGFGQITDPQPITHIPDALISVGATLAASVGGIAVTMRELRTNRESLSTLLASSHLGLKTIFYQDLVSVVGAGVALLGLLDVSRTGDLVVDGVSACIVGVLLIATGFVLAGESRELLVGKAISPAEAREVLRILEQDPRVRKVRSLQSMMLGPDDVLLALKVNFQDGLTTDLIEQAIDDVSARIRRSFPPVRHLVIEPES